MMIAPATADVIEFHRADRGHGRRDKFILGGKSILAPGGRGERDAFPWGYFNFW